MAVSKRILPLGILEKSKSNIICSYYDLYKNNDDDILNIKTFYEKIFLKNKQPITYICFQIH